MDHYREVETQRMFLNGNLVAVLHLQSVLRLYVVEVLHHVKHLGVADDGDVWPGLQDLDEACTVVRLHVVDYKEVQVPAVEGGMEVSSVLGGNRRVARIQQAGLPIFDEVAVVENALRYGECTLEEQSSAVIAAYPEEVILDGNSSFVRIFHDSSGRSI